MILFSRTRSISVSLNFKKLPIPMVRINISGPIEINSKRINSFHRKRIERLLFTLFQNDPGGC